MIGLFFKFSRFWSVRNLDLLLLILLAPGLLLVHYGETMQAEANADSLALTKELVDVAVNETESAENIASNANERLARGLHLEFYGYLWLFCGGLLLLTRLLLDPMMVRRPLLEPNLSPGGLTFIGCSLFVFLMANVIRDQPDSAPIAGGEVPAVSVDTPQGTDKSRGPGYALVNMLPANMNKTIAIGSHLAIVVGMVLIGYWHFDNIFMGIGAATLYLMLPYTALMTGRVHHVLPASLLVWAILAYRRPVAAGALLGLASGFVYYPFFLLPLWLSFYWPRGLFRFLGGFVLTIVILVGVLAIPSSDWIADIRRMFGVMQPAMHGLSGIWKEAAGGWDAYYRLPLLVAFIALSVGMALWPAQKNLGTLLSCTAAIMVATQFWHGYGGGTYMAWYLPLVLLTIFRPNLEDRVALTVLGEGWLPRRRAVLPATGQAA